MSQTDDTAKEVWSKSRLIAYPASLIEFSKVAAPLLAGFSLTAVIEITGRDGSTFFGDIATMCFSGAAALLIFAIQAGLTAACYQASPADRLAWVPEAHENRDLAVQLRRDQWDDERIADRYRERARHTYNMGIILFLAGLGFVLVPSPIDSSIPRAIGVVVVAIAALVEILTYAGRPKIFRRLLSPTAEDIDRLRASIAEAEPPQVDSSVLLRAMGGNSDHRQQSVQGPRFNRLVDERVARRMAEIEADTSGQ